MFNAEQPLEVREQSLEDLLNEAHAKEKLSRKRAILFTVIPVLAGVLFLSISLYKVQQLEQTAKNLDEEIVSKRTELDKANKTLEERESKIQAIKSDLKVATVTLVDINEGRGDPKKKANDALNVLAKTTPVNERPPVLPNVKVIPSGKFDGDTYTGSNKTKITVEVIAQGTEVRVFSTLDGKRVDGDEHVIDGKPGTNYSFTFILDKANHNQSESVRSQLLMDFDFYGNDNEPGKCQVKITDSKGITNTYQISQRSKGTALHRFYFNIV